LGKCCHLIGFYPALVVPGLKRKEQKLATNLAGYIEHSGSCEPCIALVEQSSMLLEIGRNWPKTAKTRPKGPIGHVK